MTQYIFVNVRGNYIGMDSASGGYAYEASSPFEARVWYTIEEAMRYHEIVNYGDKYTGDRTWVLMEVEGLKMHPVDFE